MKIAGLLLAVVGLAAHGQTAIFDAPTRHLTLPTVRIGLDTYTNLVLRLDAVEVVSVSAGPVVLADKCVPANFSADKFNAIVPGMTHDQVNALMGCKNATSKTYRSTSGYTTYTWMDQTTDSAYPDTRMEIYFDVDGVRVKVFSIGTTIYPYRSGRGF